MRKCFDCGWNCDDDDRERCGVCNKWLPSLKVRHKRSLESDACLLALAPVANEYGELIWSGARNALGSFPEEVVLALLKQVYILGTHKKCASLKGKYQVINSTWFYECFSCGKYVPRKGDRNNVNDDFITIDHIDSIRSFVLKHVTAQRIMVKGHCWEVYLLADCKSAHLTMSNLRPLCQSCNSKKGGSKDIDGTVSVHVKDECTGEVEEGEERLRKKKPVNYREY